MRVSGPIAVPSGIGDFSWMYSKLKHVGKLDYLVADGWPHRTVPFMQLLPEVGDVRYEEFNFRSIVGFEQNHEIGLSPTWEQVCRAYEGFGTWYLEANRHLEAGRPLAEWLPDLPTDYHYEIRVPEIDKYKVNELLANFKRPIWGVSAASYRGSEAWKTWDFAAWSRFLGLWSAEFEGTVLLVGGFWDDLSFALAADGYEEIVGKTNTAQMCHLMDVLDGYIGFSSGLGVLRTVYNKPVFMMWPDHQVELSRAWAPPDMLESRAYVASLWREPGLVFNAARMWHKENFE